MPGTAAALPTKHSPAAPNGSSGAVRRLWVPQVLSGYRHQPRWPLHASLTQQAAELCVHGSRARGGDAARTRPRGRESRRVSAVPHPEQPTGPGQRSSVVASRRKIMSEGSSVSWERVLADVWLTDGEKRSCFIMSSPPTPQPRGRNIHHGRAVLHGPQGCFSGSETWAESNYLHSSLSQNQTSGWEAAAPFPQKGRSRSARPRAEPRALASAASPQRQVLCRLLLEFAPLMSSWPPSSHRQQNEDGACSSAPGACSISPPTPEIILTRQKNTKRAERRRRFPARLSPAQTCNEQGPVQPALGDPASAGGLDWVDPQRSLPTPNILWFCDSSEPVSRCLVSDPDKSASPHWSLWCWPPCYTKRSSMVFPTLVVLVVWFPGPMLTPWSSSRSNPAQISLPKVDPNQ